MSYQRVLSYQQVLSCQQVLSYQRVLPRDLFNEAKLLKCLGFLTMAVYDRKFNRLTFGFDGEAFEICQNDSGDISVWNIEFCLDRQPIYFYTPLNSRLHYPLLCMLKRDDYDSVCSVFNEGGEFTVDFLQIVNN